MSWRGQRFASVKRVAPSGDSAVGKFHEPFGAGVFKFALGNFSVLVRAVSLLEVDDIGRGVRFGEILPIRNRLASDLRALLRIQRCGRAAGGHGVRLRKGNGNGQRQE